MDKKRIFLASSSELKDDRREFEVFINRKNKSWHSKGVFLELVIWEDFLDAVSQTRLQDEYNKAIRECDVFIMLFFTKVGKYTEEEFETAFGQFKETSKPRLYTYFKDAEISMGKANKKDMNSLWAFQEKLSALGHFYTVYRNTEDLLLQFNEQLDRLGEDWFTMPTIPSVKQDNNGTGLPKELNLNVPKTHPDDIIGRDQDLKSLHDLLWNNKRAVLVNGLGGIGKTTLVQAFISKYYDAYQHVLWITQNSESIIDDFINSEGLMKNLEIKPSGEEPALLFNEIIRKLKAIPEKPNLLIIDNAEQSLKNYRDLLPGQPAWHLIITSRETISGFYEQTLNLLKAEEASALFKRHYSHTKITDKEIKELVVEVDFHTLTIEILAKTAQLQRYDAATLKKAIKTDLKANIELPGRSGKIEKIASYLGTIFSLSQLTGQELWLMKQFTCLPAEFHSYGLLSELLVNKESEQHELLPELLETLHNKGWLLRNNESDSYKLHRIVSDIIKKQHAITLDDIIILIGEISSRLKLNELDNPVDKFTWIPFGKAILTNFEEDESNKIAVLQNNLAFVLKYLGDYQGAKTLLEKAVTSNEKNFGQDHPSVANSYSNLATVLQDLGDYEGAKALLEKAMHSDEKNLGQDHPSTAIRYSNLALVLQGLGDYEGAKTLLEKAVQSDEKSFGQDHPTTAIRYSNLGTVLKDLGEYQQAKTLLEKAMHSDEKNFGKDHPFTTIRYSNLAIVLQDLGDYQGAKTLMEKAVQATEKNFGQDHPDTAIRYSNLATVLRDLGDYQGAKALLEKALRSDEKNFGQDHPTTAIRYSNLAIVLQDLGDYQGAKALMEKAIHSDEKNFGQNHPTTALRYSNLATVLQAQGDYPGALALLEKSLSIFKRALPPEHPKIKITTDNIDFVKEKMRGE